MLFDEAVYLYLDDKQHGRKPLRPNTLDGLTFARPYTMIKTMLAIVKFGTLCALAE